VLLVDDHPLFREGVRHALETEPDFTVAAEAATLREAESLARDGDFDLAVVDLSLPDGNGLDLVKSLRALPRPPTVLVMSVYASGEFVRTAFRLGASGYVTKGTTSRILFDALRAIADGGVYADPEIAAVLVSPDSGSWSNGLRTLTPRELDVAETLSRGRTTQESADELGVSPKTIEAHRSNIYRKLGIRNVAELTRLVTASGRTD
jgi:DNA-binding NarL/FixJ family response regulator